MVTIVIDTLLSTYTSLLYAAVARASFTYTAIKSLGKEFKRISEILLITMCTQVFSIETYGNYIVINTLLSTYTCTSPLCATVADRILCHVHPYIQSAVSMNPLLRTRLIQCTHFVDMIQLFSTYSSQSCCQFPSHESHNADSPSPSNQPSLVSMRVCVYCVY